MFGRYELLERINIGGMAETIKARDTGTPGRPIVAVKRVLPHLVDDVQYLTMFGDEARILERLVHDNVIRTLEVGAVEGVPYIALEYVHGQDARSLLHRARRDGTTIPVHIACYLIAQVARGLQAAHELSDEHGAVLGLVHRDVSLQNILVSYDGEVKLIDFGIAMALDNVDRTEAGIVKGKFGYMSPEQVKGEPLDRRSDIFSLGICLWELLTGQRMFPGKSTPESIQRVRNADIEAPHALVPTIPAALDAIVMRALRKVPRDRFQTVDDLRRALLAFMNETQNECGPVALATHVREAFANELRKQPSPDVLVSEVARKFDEESGLSAFEHVDQVSAVSTLQASAAQLEDEARFLAPERPRRLHAPPGRPSVPPMRPRRASVPPSFADQFPRAPVDSPQGAAPADFAPYIAAPIATRGSGPGQLPARVPMPYRAPSEPAARSPREDLTPERVAIGRSRRLVPILAGVVTLVTLLVGAVYLSQAPEPATLQLVTRPPDVVVTVDGARVAADRSPFVLTDLEPDVKHEIIVGKLGHREWATSIVLRPGQTLALPEVTLAPLARSVTGATVNAPTASAATASPPAAAPTPPPPSAGSPAQVHAVAPPSHAAPARLEGSHVAPPTGAAATSRDGTGFLRINTRPWSEIYVDGDHVGNTPQMNLQVPAGGHVVRLSNPQFGVSKTIRIEVAPGEVVSRSLTLE